MTVTEITSLQQFKQVIGSTSPVVIDFTATWCGPCKMISPIFEALAKSGQFSGLQFYKLDVDAVSDASQEAGIRAMPTFMVFQNGNKVNELVGADQGRLEGLLQQGNSLA